MSADLDETPVVFKVLFFVSTFALLYIGTPSVYRRGGRGGGWERFSNAIISRNDAERN